ncbi:uncharacterized protein QC763_0041650 [Podospora pseudopauciseta]|uniref:Carboxypeptidase n=1 Tax=Podospora pseudopauciseta TaxID=2093780 RepID=A0ABR0HRE9_9PEZI|nr:hypothetical protein QC763_0041650 [Podospora pseudopauciseta]
MRLIPVLGFFLTAVEGLRTGRGSPLLRLGISKHINKVGKSTAAVFPDPQDKPFPKHNFLNADSTKFAANDTAIPDVDFDVGESLAAPVSRSSTRTRSLPLATRDSKTRAESLELAHPNQHRPVSTGFSTDVPTITNENELAAQFLGWWKNFVDTFGMQGYKVYISGESYAGMYCPYIANAMLNINDTAYHQLSSMYLGDAVIGDNTQLY